jgi:hypothetical protein
MNNWPTGGYGRKRRVWHQLMPEPAALAELVIWGNGKDLELEFTLVDGRTVEMGAGDITVSTDGPVEMRLERVDDLNLKIHYAGVGTEIRSMQVSWPEPDQADFIKSLRAYLADPDNESLDYCVDANISLAVRP